MDDILTMVELYPFNFSPSGWLPCDGRSVNIEDYTDLFVFLGTNFGGDGETTFALPRFDPPVGENGEPVGAYFICVEGKNPRASDDD